jgi:hypothetical protein
VTTLEVRSRARPSSDDGSGCRSSRRRSMRLSDESLRDQR